MKKLLKAIASIPLLIIWVIAIALCFATAGICGITAAAMKEIDKC